MTVENLHDAIGQLPSDLIAKVDEKRCRKPKVIPFKRYAAIAACLALVLFSSFLAVRMAAGGAKETAAEAPAAIMQAPEEANGISIAEEEAAAQAAPKEQDALPGNAGEPESPAEDAVCGYPPIETYAAGEIPPESVTEEGWEGYPEFPAEDVQYADTRNISSLCIDSTPYIRVLRSKEELSTVRTEFDGFYTMETFDDCCEIYDESWFESHDLLVVLVKSKYEDGTLSLASVTESGGDWCIRFYSSGPYTGENVSRFVLAALDKGMIPEGSHLFAMFEVP